MFSIKVSLAAAMLLTIFVFSSASAQYIYVANTGEDTVSKIDINTNQEVARYATWFTEGPLDVAHPNQVNKGPAPSRLLQGPSGDLFVLNRFFTPSHLPVLLKIAPSGGITTSISSTVLPIKDFNANGKIDPDEATDVRIQWGKEIGRTPEDVGALGRALCMDTSGVLWVGMYNTERYYRVDPIFGTMLEPLDGVPTPGHTPYGCQVDNKGHLWSVDDKYSLVEINTDTYTVTRNLSHTRFGRNYSLSLFNGCGSTPTKVYLSEWNKGRTYIVYDTQTYTFTNSPATAIPQFNALSVAVDRDGNIVSGERLQTGRVIKTTPSGVVLWDTSSTLLAGPTLPAADLHGIIIDDHNDVWVVHLEENRVVKYSGVDGKWIATVPVGNRPYTYGNPPPATCPCAEIGNPSITCERQSNGIGTFAWSFVFTNHSPFLTPATAIGITSTQVTNLNPTQFAFTNPVPPNGQATVSGTFTVADPVPDSNVCLNIRITGSNGWCCPIERVCFSLPKCVTCADLQPQFVCQNNGAWVLQLSVTNQGPTAAQSVTVHSTTAGVTVTPQESLVHPPTFPQDTPVEIPLSVAGATAGQMITLNVSLVGPFDPEVGVNRWCCTPTVTVPYPKEACYGSPDSSAVPTDKNGTYLFEDVEQGTFCSSGE